MRLNYYQFPENTPETVRLDNGCAVVLKAGDEIWTDCIPDDKRLLVDHVSFTLGPMTVTSAKKLLRLYGGSAYTEHYERGGGLFEVTEIHLTGNNSRFKYNHHL